MIATFYPTPYGSMLATHCYSTAMRFIKNGQNVQTTQMCLLNRVKNYDEVRIIEDGYTVVITNNHDGTYSCDRTDKEIRSVHNLFKMWESGVFG